jgi:prepilin-type processing-associated H-X9-DG protein
VALTVIPVFMCPSASGENPFWDPLLNELVLNKAKGNGHTGHQQLGNTSYVFCKGVTDAWCRGPNGGRPGPPGVPPSERGMFDMNWSMSIGQLKDGASKTIAVGEGSVGPAWPLTATPRDQPERLANAPLDKFGSLRIANQAWIGMEPSNAELSSQGLYVSSLFACTLEPLNKNPITDSWADVTALDDCRKSLESSPGTTGTTTCCGPHVTPNFRSDHPGGANFLFADGSVHFLLEDIDMLLYQRLSTPLDGIAVEIPED